MPRHHRDQTFRKTDVVRAFEAAKAAGISNPKISINTVSKHDPTSRKTSSQRTQITIVAGAPRDDDQTKNEWDEVTATGDEATG
jgi:hypothetical protein